MDRKEIEKAEEAAMDKYDKGRWDESIQDIEALLELADPAKRTELGMDIAWNNWKLRLKEKAAMVATAILAKKEATDTAKSMAHSLLSLYYSEKPGSENLASEHAKLAQELTPPASGMRHNMNLNSCGIAVANIGNLSRSEQILRKVAQENERLEGSGNAAEAKKAKHQRAKNGYNLASKVLIPQNRLEEAFRELSEKVIPRYKEVNAPTDLAAAYHQLAEVRRKQKRFKEALRYEEESRDLWKIHADDPSRAVQAQKNIEEIEKEIQQYQYQGNQAKIDGTDKNITARDK